VLFLYAGPMEADLAQEEVLPTNDVLFLCCSKGDGISRGAEQEGLVEKESGHKTGANGRVCLRRLEPGGELKEGQSKGCGHMGVLAGDFKCWINVGPPDFRSHDIHFKGGGNGTEYNHCVNKE